MNLSKSLRVGLANKGIIQDQLCAATHISKSTVANISKGKTGIGIGYIFLIAKALDYKLSEFIALGED